MRTFKQFFESQYHDDMKYTMDIITKIKDKWSADVEVNKPPESGKIYKDYETIGRIYNLTPEEVLWLQQNQITKLVPGGVQFRLETIRPLLAMLSNSRYVTV
jgi:hypothetical protein